MKVTSKCFHWNYLSLQNSCKPPKGIKKFGSSVHLYLCALKVSLLTQAHPPAAERHASFPSGPKPVLVHGLQAPRIAAAFSSTLLCSPVLWSSWVHFSPQAGHWGKVPHLASLNKLSSFQCSNKNFHHKHWIITLSKWGRSLKSNFVKRTVFGWLW